MAARALQTARTALTALVVLTHLCPPCAALYLQPEQGRLPAHDAAYSAAVDAWDVRLAVRENSIVIPQLGQPGQLGTGNTSCSSGSSELLKCAELQLLLGRDQPWRNDDAAHMGDSLCALQSRELAQRVQERVVCVLEGLRGLQGFVCVLFPAGLRVHNNATALERYGGPARELLLRLLHVTYVANMYMVHTQCLRVRMTAPQLAVGAVSVSNSCVRRGLQAPTFSSMRESGGVCVWYCVVGRVRWPWNSSPPANASEASLSHVCRPVPPDFVAVEFELKLELSLGSVIPRLLQADVLRWLDAVSNLTEHHMQRRTGASGFITAISVPDSVYHTQDLPSIAPQVIRARQAEYESIALQTGEGRRSLKSRRRLGTTDLVVQGLSIMPALPLSDAAWLLFTEQAVQQATSQPPPHDVQDGVLEVSLLRSSTLHRRKLGTPVEPPPEVVFSDVDVEILFLAMLLVLAYCACVACCNNCNRCDGCDACSALRSVHRRGVLKWIG